ncbi:AAA family ATPase [Antrihabitans cavernicola]|uniref:AAA family ATPase n=1 Tax=Antrihabitans cavernicola TaxID=2495913 RepID=A0A5A7SFZ5_9NOCA|nr:AAA family ATPase [Spelaeibacter cavernicola]KAA0024494.1 AAA family ATPase [Spelaeibacter cavernicola]
MTGNDNQPSTPPWLQSLPSDKSGGHPVATEPAPRKQPAPKPEPEKAPEPEASRLQEPPLLQETPRSQEAPRSHRMNEPAPEPTQQTFSPPPMPANYQPEPQQVPPAQQPPRPQQAPVSAPPNRQYPQVQQQFQPPAGPPPVAQPPVTQPPVTQPPRSSNNRYYEELDNRRKPEISTNGTVRQVPVQEDPVTQKYQAPPEQQNPSGPVYTWAPPSAAPQANNRYAPPPPQRHVEDQPQQQGGGQSVHDLSLLKRAKRPPRSGWRRAVHKASGGSINPGESAADAAYRELTERVNQPVRGDYRIAVLSLKGGVGKTTTTVGLGSTFASLRGDRVIAIDANPDLGTLAHRVPQQTPSTVRNLLDDAAISRYSDVRAHTSQAPSRLEVLASEQDPAVSEAFSEADYRKAVGILQSFYNIILTDCGTGLMHSAMSGVLDMASSLVLVTSQAIDGARSASATLDWLEHHGYGRLVERTVVVVNSSHRGSNALALDQLRRLFLDRTRAVQVVPFDDHLAEGAEIDIELVSKPTRRAFLELAAMVADDFAISGGRHANGEQQ